MSHTTINAFLSSLREADVDIRLQDENLEISFNGDEPGDEVIDVIRNRKSEIISYLRELNLLQTKPVITPVEQKQFYPVTHEQRRLWIVNATEKNNAAYHIAAHLEVKGSFDASAFKQAMHTLAMRHEVLRTVFVLKGDEPMQRIIDKNDFACRVEEASVDASAALQDVVREYVQTVRFNLESGPLFCAKIFKTGSDRFFLSFIIHHIIADAWSMSIFLKEFISIYQAVMLGINPGLPESALQYKDYAEWQRTQAGSASFQADQQYWLQQFANEPAALELPYTNNRPERKTYNGSAYRHNLSGSAINGLRELSHEKGCSLFAVLLSTIQCLMYRYTQQEDITIGTSVAGREINGLAGQIGFYAKTLPLRVQVPGSNGFDRLLSKTNEVVQQALTHQQYPFDQLVEALNFTRDISRSPLFDMMVDYFQADSDMEVAGLQISSLTIPGSTSKFDLTFTFRDFTDSMVLNIEYNTHLFDESRIRQMAMHYDILVNSLLADITAPIQALPMLPLEETTTLLSSFNGAISAEGFADITTLFEQQVMEHPAAIATSCNGTILTYSELNALSNQLARHLQSQFELCAGKVAAIMMERSERLVIALLAVLKSGAAFLPVDPNYPESNIRHLLSDSGAAVLVTDSDWMFSLAGVYEGPVFAMDIQLSTLTESTDNTGIHHNNNDLAYILYTSGSTGQPKGVEITMGNIANYLGWAADYYYQGTNSDQVAWFTSFSFDLSLTSIFTPLLRGSTLVVFPEMEVQNALQQLCSGDRSYSVVKMTPSHIDLLCYLQVSSLHVECIISGGEALKEKHIARLFELNPAIRIFDEYGPTETTVGCTVEEIKKDTAFFTIGKPIPNALIYIMNSGLQLMPMGAWGEICVGGKGVGNAYRNRAALTAEKFTENPFRSGEKIYRTGDLGRWMPDGRLVYRGRADQQVKYNGYRIEPGEIEHKLEATGLVEKAVVMVKESKDGSKTLMAFFTGDAAVNTEEIQSCLAGVLPSYMIPTNFIHTETIPLTTNGKTDRAALLKLAVTDSLRAGNYIAPQNEVQTVLTDFFEELLDIKGLGIEDNLFNRGLDSLKAIRAQSQLALLYPGKIEIHDIFSHASIARLASLLDEGKAAVAEAETNLIDF
jgi:amino acid adenylation domain-containing protein